MFVKLYALLQNLFNRFIPKSGYTNNQPLFVTNKQKWTEALWKKYDGVPGIVVDCPNYFHQNGAEGQEGAQINLIPPPNKNNFNYFFVDTTQTDGRIVAGFGDASKNTSEVPEAERYKFVTLCLNKEGLFENGTKRIECTETADNATHIQFLNSKVAICYGHSSTDSASWKTVNYPITFKIQPVILANVRDGETNGSSVPYVLHYDTSTTQARVIAYNTMSGAKASGIGFDWIAIGPIS